MSNAMGKDERQGLIRGFLARLKFPQLFVLLIALSAVDLFVMDPIPFIDEIILGILTLMLGMWRRRQDDDEPERTMKNVTPGAGRGPR